MSRWQAYRRPSAASGAGRSVVRGPSGWLAPRRHRKARTSPLTPALRAGRQAPAWSHRAHG
eukprot:scaffold200406_cov32-Tisochrysis_lutea.AAC.3